MRIAYITAGAAGMYCGSCLHDNTLAAALMARGHEVALIPTYTPTRTDEEDVSIDRVFYGAVNVYLEQKSAVFRHAPEAIHWLLDRPALLNWVSGRGVSVDPSQLGDLTLSVARGETGKQRRELEELVGWLRDEFKPEVVHITNSMFLGLAEPLKRELGVPVLCSLQGEDIFLDDLSEPFKTEVHGQLQAHARHVDGLIAPCTYYADFMAEYLAVPRERVHVVRLGIKLEGHGEAAPGRKRGDDHEGRSEPPASGAAAAPVAVGGERPFVVGYLARIAPEKGLHVLVEAFRLLAERVGKNAVFLRTAGWLGKREEPYLAEVRRRLAELDLHDRFDYAGELTRDEKIAFLNGIDVLSVPTTYRDPKGLFVLEALANGVPVVQPRHGAFPEVIEATGGGLLAEPDSPASVAEHLETLMHDTELRKRLGNAGKESVHTDFSDVAMAEATLAVYSSHVGQRAERERPTAPHEAVATGNR